MQYFPTLENIRTLDMTVKSQEQFITCETGYNVNGSLPSPAMCVMSTHSLNTPLYNSSIPNAMQYPKLDPRPLKRH